MVETNPSIGSRIAGKIGRFIFRPVIRRLGDIEDRISRMEHFAQGGRATYVGGGRVLVKSILRDTQIVYYVDGEDRLLSPWFIASGVYELDLTEYFLRTLRPDDHCMDIGANFGFFTCLFGRFAPQGRIIGVEPEPATYALLRDNVHANGLAGIAQPMPMAIADHAGMVTLHRRPKRPGNTSIARATDDLVQALGEPPPEHFDIACQRIDDLAAHMQGRVDVMKVDVEGAEPLVLSGARETIARNPGIQIVVEWSPSQLRGAGFDAGAFLDDVLAMELRVFDIAQGTAVAISREALLGLDYRAGILLARTPR